MGSHEWCESHDLHANGYLLKIMLGTSHAILITMVFMTFVIGMSRQAFRHLMKLSGKTSVMMAILGMAHRLVCR